MSSTIKPRILWIDLRLRRSEAQIPTAFVETCEVKLVGNEADKGRIDDFGPHALCMDFDYPDLPGLRLLQDTKRMHPSLPLIMLTEQHSEDLAVWAFRNGVWDFLARPLDATEAQRTVESLVKLVSSSTSRRAPLRREAPRIPDEARFMGTKSSRSNMDRAIAYIKKNLGEKIQEQVLAEHCNMSPFRFSRAFKKATGITFQEFVIRARIKEACRLMRNPSATISDIAYTVGFNDPSYFGRIFRRFMGETPSEYRKHLSGVTEERSDLWARLELAVDGPD